jgi:predicted negative regulator of RcsB-dependent stress response
MIKLPINQFLSMTRSLHFLCLVFLCISFPVLQAQVSQALGWESIVNNNFKAAANCFQKILAENPKDENALCGLIFIAETTEDYAGYKKYIKQLIDSGVNQEQYIDLFGHLYDARPEEVLGMDIPEALKVGATFRLADSIFSKRRFSESKEIMRSVIGDYEWSVIGPFDNVSGSGFVETPEVETVPFDLDATYKNDSGFELKWNKRIIRDPNGIVSFHSVLPATSEGTYYGNTFITVPEDRKVQFRIGRSAPMKIWLDGDLIFTQPGNIDYNWDYEVLRFDIKKGIHRLLVKMAPMPEDGSDSKLKLNFHEQSDNGSSASNEYGESNNAYRGFYMAPTLALRITNEEGKLWKDISSSFEGDFQQQKYKVTETRTPLLFFYNNEIASSPNSLRNYYLLSKSYLKYGFNEEGEAAFAKIAEAHKNSLYFKYLLAKFYAINNKGEKAEELISEMNEEKAPIFPLMASKLAEIDEEKNEVEYLEALDKLLTVSPTHWKTIYAKLDHYSKKGKTTEKRDFVKQFLEKHPEKKYKKRLEPFLKDDSYKPSSHKPTTDKEREKSAKKAMRKLKKEFKIGTYMTVLNYYKRKEKTEQVLKLYDGLIKGYPYYTYYRKQKSDYLFEKDKEDLALYELSKVLKINPYDANVYETIGDIYFEKEEKEIAMENYEKAQCLGKIGYYYGADRLKGKIEKIENQQSLKKYFDPLSFDEILADSANWKTKFADEESVILLYTVEGALDRDNELDYNQKLMIKIKNEAGAKYWTEANFGFMGDISFVKVIKADGRITSPSRNYGYVVFKNLKAGDIIQLEGNSKGDMTREIPNEMYHITASSFEVPVNRARLEYVIPTDKPFETQCYRSDCTYTTRTVDDFTAYTWELKDIKKMEYEDAVKDNLDSYTWFMYSTLKDWSEVVKWYLRKTYRRLETNYEVKGVVQTVVNDAMSEEEKVTAIYNYLTKEITYSFVSFLNSNYIPKKPGETLSGEVGDCKDVASLMISMLREVGVDAWYVLVRSGNFTEQTPLPTIAAFNHVIVGYQLSDGEMRYLDLTTDYFPHYVLPESDARAWALLVKEGETQVFRLPDQTISEDRSRFDINIKGKINANRTLDMDVAYAGSGVLGGTLRESLNRVTTIDDRKKFLTEYFAEGVFDHLLLNDFSFENLEDITAPLNGSLSLKAYNHMQRVSDFFIIQIPILKGVTTRPALFAEKRYNNLDLAQLFELTPAFQQIDLEIPTEFRLMDLPKDIKMDNQFGRYLLHFEKTNTGLKIIREMVWKMRLVNYEDYDDFKAFYLKVLDGDRMKLGVARM